MPFGHKASRKQTFALVGLIGHSGTGKTYSALRIAKGLAGSGLVAMIDTENGRGEMYGDEFSYSVEQLTAPFSPNRYADLITQAQDSGAKVLIIDSFSHEWEGTGGVVEMAEDGGGKGLRKWTVPKAMHKRLVNAVCQARMHVITCMRGKDEILEREVNGKKEYVKTGVVLPIQDARFNYEMTVSLVMQGDGAYKLGKNCPAKLRPHFDGSQVTERLGKELALWLGEGSPESPEEAWLRDARIKAGEGKAAFEAFWKSISPISRKCLEKYGQELKTIRDAAEAALQDEKEPSEEFSGNSNGVGLFGDSPAAESIAIRIRDARTHEELIAIQQRIDTAVANGELIASEAEQLRDEVSGKRKQV